MQIPNDTRYGNPDYLNFSTLASAISYDIYGTRTFNPLALFKPKQEPSDAMLCGTMVDEHLTEGINFYEKYLPVSKRSGKVDNEITNSMFGAVDSVLKTYSALPVELLSLVESSVYQETLACDYLKIKWKMDFYNTESNHIIDLKVPWLDDYFTKDLYIGKDRRINPYHRYSMQMAWYSYLVEKNHGKYPSAALLAIDHKGNALYIDIPEETRKIAWSILLEDINILRLSEWFSYQVTPMMQDNSDDTETTDSSDGDDFLDTITI